MGILDNLIKLISQQPPKQTKATSSSEGLAYTQTGTGPQRDLKNRVVAKLASGSQLVFSVNKQHVTGEALKYLMGKPKEDDEVSRSVRLRMFRDDESQFANSVKLETPRGDLVGWILKADSDLACKLIDQLDDALKAHDPALRGERIVFDVSAKVSGYSMMPEDEDDEPYDLEEVEIRIKDPVEMDVDGEK